MCKMDSTYRMCRVVFFVCLVTSVLLIVAGFFIPPRGEISGSVLTAVGELLLFPAIAYGFRAVETGMELHIRKGDIHVDITKDDDKDE